MKYRTLKKTTYIGLLILDFIGVLFSFYLAYILRSRLPDENYYLPAKPYFTLSIILGVLYVLILHGDNTQKKHPFESYAFEVWGVANSIIKGTIIFMAVAFLYRGFSISRLIVVFHFVLAIFIISIFRLIWRLTIIEHAIKTTAKRQILVLISYNSTASTAERPEDQGKPSEDTRQFIVNEASPQLLKDLEELIKREEIDCIEIREKDFSIDFILNVALLASKLQIDVRVKPDLISLMPLKFTIEESDGEIYWTAGKGLRELYPRTLKRIFDVFFALIMLIIFFIPGLIFAILIAFTSRGGVFFRHERIGVGGKKIHILKFRTMYADAEERLKNNPELYADFLKGYKLKNDPRVTPIGSFLRRTSFDELPQVINILKGEMSFVGPRPVVEDELQRYGKFSDLLMSVTPGLTGLWQVSGRSDLTYEERVRLDLYYVENWSLGLDLLILARTLPVLILRKGAY